VTVRLLFGTTSYVLPADLLPNVRLLAPLVDDIELILFEGEESNLPRRGDVAEMGRLARESGSGFTVHLPLDVGIGELDPVLRRRAQETCLRVVDLTLELEPHAFVVHPELPLAYHPPFGEAPQPLDSLAPGFKARWLEALGESLARIAALTGDFPLALENLQFPYAWVRELLDDLDLGVTFDVGHLLSAGGVVSDHLTAIGDRLTVVHLHGFADGRDHQALTSYPKTELAAMLAGFAAVPTRRPALASDDNLPAIVVSLEVFGWRPTVPSLRALGEVLQGDAGNRALAAAAGIAAAVEAWGPSAED
jgi:sugar phosphate isomerase/epimerase